MAKSPTDWTSLSHAYGAAGDIPALLKAAESATAPKLKRFDQEPWFSLWSALCHQGDVYPASYAAVPELVRIAESRVGSARAECLLLAGCIEVERHAAKAPVMPTALAEAYQEALVAGAAIATATLRSGGEGMDRRKVELALAAFSGDLPWARKLLGDEDEGEP